MERPNRSFIVPKVNKDDGDDDIQGTLATITNSQCTVSVKPGMMS